MRQGLALAAGVLAVLAAPAAAADRWQGSWGAAQVATGGDTAWPATRSRDVTLRQIVRVSAGGRRMRVLLSNVHGTEPLTIDGDQDLLHRAVFNLVLNGVQHAGPTGRVRVELGRADDYEVPASVPIESPVRITVEDSGPGIREEDIGRLFDPFFTTRNGGNGLGLAMVHRAIEAHRGAILVDGNVGRGARFTVYLPAHTNGRRN